MTYDDCRRVVKNINALENSAYTTYDNSGNVLTSTDYAGNLMSYIYDDFDRIASKTNSGGVIKDPEMLEKITNDCAEHKEMLSVCREVLVKELNSGKCYVDDTDKLLTLTFNSKFLIKS